LSDGFHRLVANGEIQHQQAVQLGESDRVRCSAHRIVLSQHALDDAVVEDSYLTEQAQARDLAVELVDVLRPPRDLEVVLCGHVPASPDWPRARADRDT